MTTIKTLALCAGVCGVFYSTTPAQARGADVPPTGLQFQSRDQVRARVGDRQIQQILTRIRTDSEALRSARSGYGSSRGDTLTYLIDDLQAASDHLADHLTRRIVTRADVDDVLQFGSQIDQAMRQSAARGWTALRRDLDDLAAAYDLTTDWQQSPYSPNRYSVGAYGQLTGTYQLDTARSDDPQQAADRALRRLPAADRDRVQQQIQNRLDPPEAIAIDRQGTRVTIASSRAPQVAFDLDGRARTETGPRGGTMTTRANAYGDQLEVTVTGTNGTDFTAIFEPLDNGDALRVTRRLMVTRLTQPVELASVYRRTSDRPDWSVYYDVPTRGASGSRSSYGSVVIPDNMTMTATLNQALNVGTARQNDRVSLTVRNGSRSDLDGATIEGYIASAPSRMNDRTQLQVDFDRITLRDGRSATFAGVVESVRGPDGRPIDFNGETVSRDTSNQTEQAVQRGAIGAAVGALIGAIAGGGKGAAIGAVLGGGGAAATVFIDDASQRTLPVGTEFTIRTRAY
jgi:hypothetical protein